MDRVSARGPVARSFGRLLLGHPGRWVPRRPGQAAVVVVSVAATVLASVSLRGTGSPLALHLVAGGWLAGVNALLVVEAFRPTLDSSRALTRLAWSTPPVALTVQLASFGLEPARWDLMWVSAGLGVVAGRGVVVGVPDRLRRMLRRLGERGALAGGLDDADELWRELDRRGHRWAWVCGSAAAVAFTATGPWAAAGLGAFHDPAIWPTPFGAAYFVPILLGVMVVGAWLGRAAAFGRLGAVVRRLGMRLRVVPDHPDGAGGLRPIGAFFLHQSVLAAVPPVFTIVWLFLFAVAGGAGFAGQYELYATQFTWLLLPLVCGEILAFIVPILSIHTIMRAEKETTLWSESDQISQRIVALRAQLAEADGADDQERERRLAALVRRFEMLEATPTWPVDASIRRRFTLRNIGLLLPVAGYVFGNASFWERLGEFLGGLQ